MRARLSLVLSSLVAMTSILVGVSLLTPAAQASPADDYVGPYFGDGKLPPGCILDMDRNNPANVCFHERVGLNALDSPKVDVAVLVPASPTAERDLRIMRQAVQAWEGGIHYLAEEMGLDWLAEGVDFNITPSIVDLAEGKEFSSYPLVDPEIVVLATNTPGGAGIGIDPLYFSSALEIVGEDGVPCHNVPNPFSLETWEGMPGYDGHHGEGGGVFVEDCGGAGGNVCFSVNGALDPVPGKTDIFSLFDLVLHETGHCLTLGHVGDGAEGPWGPVPTTDIMAYSYDPPGQNKCVSTLNVEGFAVRMSRYLDVNGDGAVTADDRLEANDRVGDGVNSFQVQHPDNHHYASSTGSVWDCPQPDLGILPGEPTDWTPTPVDTTTPVLNVATPGHGGETTDGKVNVSGTVERRPIDAPPTSTTAAHDDPEGDALSETTDIEQFSVEVDALEVTAVVKVAKLASDPVTAKAPSVSLSIDGRQIESYETGTWDHSMETGLPAEWSEWDAVASTVTFHIPRSFLAEAKVTAPYDVFALSGIKGNAWTVVADDRAPDKGSIGVAAPAETTSGSTTTGSTTTGSTGSGSTGSAVGSLLNTIEFERPGGNTFTVLDSSLGLDNSKAHEYTLNVPELSDVELTLTWGDNSDLDIMVSGDENEDGINPVGMRDGLMLREVQGQFTLTVLPYFVVGVPNTTYTLTARVAPLTADTDGDGITDRLDLCPADAGIAPSGCPDTDGDGVPDVNDLCPSEAGNGAQGCPVPATEQVRVYVDDALAASQDVDTSKKVDTFAIDVTIPGGVHELRIVWEDDGEVIATDVRTVVYGTPGTDRDGDGTKDSADNCVKQPNADQADLDRDGLGNACDSDIDGDGHSNAKEEARGTNPYDPLSYPGRKPAGTSLRL